MMFYSWRAERLCRGCDYYTPFNGTKCSLSKNPRYHIGLIKKGNCSWVSIDGVHVKLTKDKVFVGKEVYPRYAKSLAKVLDSS